MYILGISCYYHDSSATLLKDGLVVAAAQEERFTRKKHDLSFPENAIKFCLENQNIKIENVDYIAFYEKPFLKFERLLYQHLQSFPRSYKVFVENIPSWVNQKLRVLKKIRKELKYEKKIFFVEHHLAHAAGSFFSSPFEEAALLIIDGVGEWATASYGKGIKNNIELLKEIKFPSSLGLLYSTITSYLGFNVNNSEYKVMGLSAYGNMNKTNPYYIKLKELIDIKDDGSFRLDMSYFSFHYSKEMFSEKLCKLFDGDMRKPNENLTKRHKDIAAALQLITEEIVIKMLNKIYREINSDNIVLAGGVALNSVLNGKILKSTSFKKIWIQPDPGDGGTSLGAAFYTYNSILNNDRNYQLKDPYLGPGFSRKEI